MIHRFPLRHAPTTLHRQAVLHTIELLLARKTKRNRREGDGNGPYGKARAAGTTRGARHRREERAQAYRLYPGITASGTPKLPAGGAGNTGNPAFRWHCWYRWYAWHGWYAQFGRGRPFAANPAAAGAPATRHVHSCHPRLHFSSSTASPLRLSSSAGALPGGVRSRSWGG